MNRGISAHKVRSCSKDLLSQLNCSILSTDACQEISTCYILVNLPQVVLKFYHCLRVALQELKSLTSSLKSTAFISFVTWGILAQFADSHFLHGGKEEASVLQKGVELERCTCFFKSNYLSYISFEVV